MTEEYKVYIIIVTYNGERWLEKLFRSIEQSEYPVRTIIIDNNSNDNTLSFLKKFNENNKDHTEIIFSDKNLGFGAANNIGIKKAIDAGADAVFLLNQDAFIYPDSIGNLVEQAKQNDYGIISPFHYKGDEVTLDENFETYLSRSKDTREAIFNVDFVNAAAWLVSKKCIESVGGFHPVFFHYGEDRNYCDRVLYHQLSIQITSRSKICHDRIIRRDGKKDLILAKSKIKCSFLNINKSIFSSYFQAAKETIGLSKYYGRKNRMTVFEKLSFFSKLFGYFISFGGRIGGVLSIRKEMKKGTFNLMTKL